MNVVLVSVDAMRADRMNCTPVISSLAERGAVFSNAVSQANSTDPSHASIFTGAYPNRHGVRENGVFFKPGVLTLPEVFSKAGYKTMGAVSVEHLSSFFGWNLGFGSYFNNHKNDKYFHWFSKLNLKVRGYRSSSLLYFLRRIGLLSNTHWRPAVETNRDVFKWLELNAKNPFFAFIHYFDAHQYGHEDSKKYDEKVALVDAQVGALVEKLKELKVLDDTLIVVTADHGEAFGEHGYFGHGRQLYEEELRVPLVFFYPKKLYHKRFFHVVRLIDIAPTVLELVGWRVPASMQGKSVFGGVDRIAFSEAYPPYSKAKCVRVGNWKFISDGTKRELFDLKTDSLERNNLVESNKEKALELECLLDSWVDFGGAYVEPERDEYTKESLRGLGYL